MQELDTAYRILDLEPGASMEEVNQAYKDLVFIWHPDRLPKDNLRLVEKAQEKIKQLNQARDYLRTHARVGTTAASNSHAASSTASNGYRSRTRPYGRTASNYGYRQRPNYGRTAESASSQQTYQNPYRAYQARYAQTGYGSYGAYRRPDQRSAETHTNSTGSTGDRASTSSQRQAWRQMPSGPPRLG
jgi:curved DNA-binding protein CbpA